MMTVKTSTIPVVADLQEYVKNLTVYAFKKVAAQYEQSLTMQPLQNSSNGEMSFLSSSGLVTCTLSACSCSHFSTMQLVCKHIFYMRKQKQLPAYSEETCNSRWLKRCYREHCDLKVADRLAVVHSQVRLDNVTGGEEAASHTLSQAAKYRKAKNLTNTLAALCSEPGMTMYKDRIALLQQLADMWMRNESVCIVSPTVANHVEGVDDNDANEATAASEGRLLSHELHHFISILLIRMQ